MTWYIHQLELDLNLASALHTLEPRHHRPAGSVTITDDGHHVTVTDPGPSEPATYAEPHAASLAVAAFLAATQDHTLVATNGDGSTIWLPGTRPTVRLISTRAVPLRL
ncbi:hypothetical protein [Mobilicoccus pelagius]|uniref:Uncharacterized protein n=1 Tax=Mobilicoccus pelagius NBRC 104925 TaxID=1089455 RepID=H5UUB7_9MICO|nr:hypothetical protein [Mobilicoccus pelagius]GAB49325.1 hypothetical protein MOPEL_113_00050 [Mobilicoccus pelagius NBRC 104925]